MWTECELNDLDNEHELVFTEKKQIRVGKRLALLVNKVMQNRIIGSQFSLIKITLFFKITVSAISRGQVKEL